MASCGLAAGAVCAKDKPGSEDIPDKATAKIDALDVEGQTQQVLANIRALLKSQGLELSDVVKSTVFLQNMADFPKVNALYEAAFGGHKPARSTVQVAALPLSALVEIEVIVQLRD
jgi:2-iminobutanoate/2-iminopropanoate deaminase